ncbi:MAG: hypothetical protein ACUVRZ_05785 [Desulfobacca sp.]|uniref:hypothetical protein n=1 Tax=Desulfobacca sp. TaxID=2067990 RepID=UPI00404B4909
MSFWKKLFGKKNDTAAAAPAGRGAVAFYGDKYAQYQELLSESGAIRELLGRLQAALTASPSAVTAAVPQLCQDLLQHLDQTFAVLQTFCRQMPADLSQAYADMSAPLRQAATAKGPQVAVQAETLLAALRQLAALPATPAPEPGPSSAYRSLWDLLAAIDAARQDEMFCLSLRAQVSKKQAASLVTGRLVPILVVDVNGGLARAAATVGLEDIASVPFQAFLTGMLSIPWPKARPVDMKGFISVVGVTSTTPRSEDQLKKISLAILARDYMNFSLCLGYHASTIEAYVSDPPRCNYLRFYYQGGAASVERRVRRLRLISGILTRLGFEVSITGDLLDGRKQGDDLPTSLKLLEILGRLEVFTKQMDMVMSSDEVIYGYIDDFLAKHC